MKHLLLLIATWSCLGQAPEAWREVNDQGKALLEAGRCREALPLFVRARGLVGEDAEGAATSGNSLGAVYLCLGQYTRAERAFRDVLHFLPTDRFGEIRSAVLNNLGVLSIRLGSLTEAAGLLVEGLAVSTAVFPADHLMVATATHSLGVLRLETREYAEARDLFFRALSIFEAKAGDHVYTATVRNNLGVAKMYLKDFQGALVHTERALELRRKLLPASHPDLGVSLHNHAVALERTGKQRLAKEAFREAKSIRAISASGSLTGLTVDRKVLEKR